MNINFKSWVFGFWASTVLMLFLLCVNDMFGSGSAAAVEMISVLYVVMLMWPFYTWLASFQRTRDRILYGLLVILIVGSGWFYVSARNYRRMVEIQQRMDEQMNLDISKAFQHRGSHNDGKQ